MVFYARHPNKASERANNPLRCGYFDDLKQYVAGRPSICWNFSMMTLTWNLCLWGRANTYQALWIEMRTSVLWALVLNQMRLRQSWRHCLAQTQRSRAWTYILMAPSPSRMEVGNALLLLEDALAPQSSNSTSGMNMKLNWSSSRSCWLNRFQRCWT